MKYLSKCRVILTSQSELRDARLDGPGTMGKTLS